MTHIKQMVVMAMKRQCNTDGCHDNEETNCKTDCCHGSEERCNTDGCHDNEKHLKKANICKFISSNQLMTPKF